MRRTKAKFICVYVSSSGFVLYSHQDKRDLDLEDSRSEYELRREANVAENKRVLLTLGLAA